MILFRSYSSPSGCPVVFSTGLVLPRPSTDRIAPCKRGLVGSAQPRRCIGCSVTRRSDRQAPSLESVNATILLRCFPRMARHPLPGYGARWRVLHRRVLHQLIVLFSAYEHFFGAAGRNIGTGEKTSPAGPRPGRGQRPSAGRGRRGHGRG